MNRGFWDELGRAAAGGERLASGGGAAGSEQCDGKGVQRQGELSLPEPIIALAPMDGVTDAAFRYMTCKYSRPSFTMTEFTNVEGLARGAVKMLAAFIYDESERPVVGQIFGTEVESFYKATVMLCAMGFDGVDINMGCPALKVANKGSGAGLIRTPELAREIIRACKRGARDWAEGISLEAAGVHEAIIAEIEVMRAKGLLGKKLLGREQVCAGREIAEKCGCKSVSMSEKVCTCRDAEVRQKECACAQMGKSARADFLPVKMAEESRLGSGNFCRAAKGEGGSDSGSRNAFCGKGDARGGCCGSGDAFCAKSDSGSNAGRINDGTDKTEKVERRLIPISVKTRIGYDSIVTEEWIKTLLEEQPANISLHGRTLKQMYMGKANWEEIAKAAQICREWRGGSGGSGSFSNCSSNSNDSSGGHGTTLMGNGDIESMADAYEKITTYGVDGVLVGRATFGDPWFFGGREPDTAERLRVMIEHAFYFQKLNHVSFFNMRKHLGWYCKGFDGAKELRKELMQAENAQQVERLTEKYL